MNELDLKLYELLGSKTLSFGCLVKLNSEKTQTNAVFLRHSETYKRDYLLSDKGLVEIDRSGGDRYVKYSTKKYEIEKIIGHEPTSTDLFKWMIDNDCAYATLGLWDDCLIFYGEGTGRERVKIPFDLSKKLIDQSEETKRAIVELISSHA